MSLVSSSYERLYFRDSKYEQSLTDGKNLGKLQSTNLAMVSNLSKKSPSIIEISSIIRCWHFFHCLNTAGRFIAASMQCWTFDEQSVSH